MTTTSQVPTRRESPIGALGRSNVAEFIAVWEFVLSALDALHFVCTWLLVGVCLSTAFAFAQWVETMPDPVPVPWSLLFHLLVVWAFTHMRFEINRFRQRTVQRIAAYRANRWPDE